MIHAYIDAAALFIAGVAFGVAITTNDVIALGSSITLLLLFGLDIRRYR